MQCLSVGVRVDGHGSHPQPAGGAHDATGDLPTVGNHHLVDGAGGAALVVAARGESPQPGDIRT